MGGSRPWWHRDRHADRRPLLVLRGRIKSAIRAWFEAQGYQEVDIACLQVSPGNEAHLHAFKTEFVTEAGARSPYYLHTSPEFAMKKLLAAGETRIFTFAPVFRNGERGRLHFPEFTMLEWYEAGAKYERLMEQCGELLRLAAAVADKKYVTWGGMTVDSAAPSERISMAQAFQRFAGIDLLGTLGAREPDRAGLAAAVARAGLRVAADDTWSDLFSRVIVERVEPALASLPHAAILMQYPTVEAALARPTTHDPRVAERFEFYACGIELANAFGELTDPAEQRRRFEAEMAEKQRVYGHRYPLDEEFLAALAQMPPASGAALGFDRLVMLASGATHIEHVLWTPVA